jgi:hypothetical protein
VEGSTSSSSISIALYALLMAGEERGMCDVSG